MNNYQPLPGFLAFAALSLLLAACGSASHPSTEDPAVPPIVGLTPSSASEVPTASTEQPTQEPTQTTEALRSGSVRISAIDGMEQIYIEAGEFTLGSEDDEAKQTADGGVASVEGPEHSLFLDAYWIDKYEVTNAQYSLCVNEGACKTPALVDSFTGADFDYYLNPEFANYPVVNVDYYMARDYCTWAGRRLPTEAEWEKAARSADERKYPWGNEPVSNEKANFCDENCERPPSNPSFDDGYAQTAPVGSYPAGASPFGVLDMAGNVWEWTSTIPMDYPYDPLDGREEPDPRLGTCSPPDCAENETAFGDGPQRVWRGGTWSNGIWWVRATVRYHSVPGYWHSGLGFRCAASP